MNTKPENAGLPILSLTDQAKTWTPRVFAQVYADTMLLWLPTEEADDDSDDWAYQTTYIRSVPDARGGIGFIDVKKTTVYPLRKARKGAFADTILVGRSASNDVSIDHASISKLHARIRRRPDGSWRLSDADSLNGTKVNGHALTCDVSVRDADKVMFGSLTFEVYDAARLHQLLLRLD